MTVKTNIIALAIWLLSGALFQAKAEDTVVIYTSPEAPYDFVGPDGKIDGVLVRLVHGVMEASGLPYEIKQLPWNRSIRRTKTDHNSLFLGLARMTSREEDYYWLVPLVRRVPVLYGQQHDQRIVSRKDIKSGKYKSICIANSAPCAILRAAGFPESSLFIYKYFNYDSTHNFLKSGRVDVILYDSLTHYYNSLLERGGLADFEIKPMFVLEDLTMTLYLVAGKHIDILTRKAITDAYKRMSLSGMQLPLTIEESKQLVDEILKK